MYLPWGAHQAFKALAAGLAGFHGGLLGWGGVTAGQPGVALPGQPLGFIAQQHTHIDREHVSYAGGQQVVQCVEGNHLIPQLEQAAAIPLAYAAHLHTHCDPSEQSRLSKRLHVQDVWQGGVKSTA